MSPHRLLHDPAAVATLDGLGAGLGGAIKERPEDFLVEELPLFRPSGRGDHTIALIENANLIKKVVFPSEILPPYLTISEPYRAQPGKPGVYANVPRRQKKQMQTNGSPD